MTRETEADQDIDMLARLDYAYDRWWGTDEKDPEPLTEWNHCYLGLVIRVARNEIRQLREKLGIHPHHFPGPPITKPVDLGMAEAEGD